MGAVVNMRPDLFNAVIMGVPFVDVLTTMADETIPLTSIEWEEWGNPAVSLLPYCAYLALLGDGCDTTLTIMSWSSMFCVLATLKIEG